jgi:hypothetical protein
MARKTFEVQALKERINKMILNGADDAKSERAAIGIVLEEVLMATKNYSGFQYLDTQMMKESKNGTTVGINDVTYESEDDSKYKEKFANTDHTRVRYF